MMSFVSLILFTIPLCFMQNMFWMIQLILFGMSFLFIGLNINLHYFNLSYFLGMDMISYGLILLSIWICALMVMSAENLFTNKYYIEFFLFNVIFLLLMLYLTFSSMNLFMFYLFFEGSLIPIMLLIFGWGYQVERIQASIYLLFYTLFASLPLLLGIFFVNASFDSIMIYMLKFYSLNYFYLYVCMIFAFLVKMPMYFVHLWLPKAHVEAPVFGSMILAGIMLKLGGYGLLRVLIMFQGINFSVGLGLIIFSLIGGFIISLVSLCQVDLKSLIAYSSVVHMSMVIGGIFTINSWGFVGSYLLMIGHGLCSSGLFYLVNVNYERFHSRSLFINKGLINYMPSVSLWWFLLVSSNMAAPPSLNLMGEMFLINSLISWSNTLIIILMLISFFSAAYSLYLYSFSQHGMFLVGFYSFSMAVSREFLVLFLHWMPLNILILKLDYLII